MAFDPSSLLGVLVGAGLAYLGTRSHEARKQREALRSDVFADYLKAASACAFAGNAYVEIEKAREQLTSAKSRMCLCAGSETLLALRDFEATGASLASREGLLAFMRLVVSMRREMGQGEVERPVLLRLLFNEQVAAELEANGDVVALPAKLQAK